MKKTLPPTFFLLALILMIGLHYGWPIHRYWQFPLNLVGLVPLLVGIGLNVAADRLFAHHGTTVKPFEQPSALVTAFPFSISRNPMYLGVTFMLIGVALLLGTVSPLIPTAAFALLMDRRFIKIEERTLAERFGDQWGQYCSQVRRWI